MISWAGCSPASAPHWSTGRATHGQVGRRPPGARTRPGIGQIPARGHCQLRRRLQQSRADLWQKRVIFNPPSAWAVAKRDNPPVAADCWTFPAPAGPKGSFSPILPFFWGIWQFSRNKRAAKELIDYLCQREQVEERCAAQGYDVPPFNTMPDFKVWEGVEPPHGTLFNYPLQPGHNSRPDRVSGAAGNRGADLQPWHDAHDGRQAASGQSIEDVMAWAQEELEGFCASERRGRGGARPVPPRADFDG